MLGGVFEDLFRFGKDSLPSLNVPFFFSFRGVVMSKRKSEFDEKIEDEDGGDTVVEDDESEFEPSDEEDRA